MRLSYSLILPYLIQIYLISAKFIMLPYGYFTEPPLYTDFDGDTEMIFARLILTCTGKIHRSEKRESTIFSHPRMDFPPKKAGNRGLIQVKQDFLKKVRYCIIFRQKKQGRTIVQNARWWGGDNLSIKGLYLKTLCDLHFLERSCRIKS